MFEPPSADVSEDRLIGGGGGGAMGMKNSARVSALKERNVGGGGGGAGGIVNRRVLLSSVVVFLTPDRESGKGVLEAGVV